MRKIALLFALFFSILTNSIAQYAPSWSWRNHYGSKGDDLSLMIKTDNDGNNYTLVRFIDTISFGSTTFNVNSEFEYAIIKQDKDGNVLFAKKIYSPYVIGLSTLVEPKAIAVDNNQNIYVAGDFRDTLVTDTISVSSTTHDMDGFIAKYNKDGHVVWVKDFGGNGNDYLNDMTLDTAGNIIVETYFSGVTSKTYDTISVSVSSTSDNMMVGKINPSGNFLWVTCPKKGNISPAYLAVDHYNDIYMVGQLRLLVSFDGTSYIHKQQSDIMMLKFNSSGTFMWSNTPDSTGYGYVQGIAFDQENDLYITGMVRQFAVFNDTNAYYTSNVNCVYLAKYDTSGTNIWGKLYEAHNPSSYLHLATDMNNNCYMTADVKGPWTSGTHTIISLGGMTPNAPALISFNSTGNIQWYKSADTTGTFTGVATDHANNIYLSGVYTYDGNPFHIGDSSLLVVDTGWSKYFSIHDILIAKIQAQELIIPGTQDKNVYCAGDSLYIPYTIIDTAFGSGNIFRLQISDTGGQFTHPFTIGTTTSLTTPAIFAVTLPDFLITGHHYKLQIQSTNPAFTSWAYDTAFTVYALPIKPIISVIGTRLQFTPSTGDTYQWYRNDTLLPGANSSTYTPPINGYYYVTATNANGCSVMSDSIRYAEGIGTINGNSDAILIYPNPVTTNTIRINSPENIKMVSLHDITGRSVQSWGHVTGKNVTLDMNTNAYSQGIYFIDVYTTNGHIYHQKILLETDK